MKLVVFYDIEKYKSENRVFAPSVVAIINYIAKTLNTLGEEVEIVSAAETRNKKGVYPFRSEYISDNIKLTQTFSKGCNNKILREVSKIRSRLWLVQYLKKNTDKNEVIFFWDSPVLYEPLILFGLLNKKKKVKILYFATEIFQEILHLGMIKRKMEWFLFKNADLLLVSTELLNSKINKDRPYLTLHGTYEAKADYNERFYDELIHIVYAGVINSNKGSSKTIQLAALLPGKYKIHILGYGKDNDLEIMNKEIDASNKKHDCQISYEGILTGDNYDRFLQKCNIGLCPQDLNSKYNESSFPSKILSYMSNGLRVVSVDIKAIRTSEIGEYIYYSKSDKPQDIVKALEQIDINAPYDSRKIIEDLDNVFLRNLKKLIKE